MTRYVFSYIAVLVFFVGIDLVWLGWVARSTYLAEMGNLLRKDPNLTAAAVFYVMYAGGLLLFSVAPGIGSGSVLKGLLLGGGLGLIAYGTYDLTNLTIMNGFSLRIALIDMVWGTVLSGAAAAFGVAVTSKLLP